MKEGDHDVARSQALAVRGLEIDVSTHAVSSRRMRLRLVYRALVVDSHNPAVTGGMSPDLDSVPEQ